LFPALESVEGIGKQRAAAIMKAYGSIENIAAADPADLAKNCRVGKTAAKAVRAAARLALEDRKAFKQKLTVRRQAKNIGAKLAAEAAEPAPEYES
jgi:ERCC4-type nuclease